MTYKKEEYVETTEMRIFRWMKGWQRKRRNYGRFVNGNITFCAGEHNYHDG